VIRLALIYFVSDPHLGRNYNFKEDPFTGISKRALDPINNLEMVVKDAIQQKAGLFVICGDLYDRTNIGSTFRKIIRKRIFRPLSKEGIQVIVIGGNHDSPRNLQRGSDIEDLSLSHEILVSRVPKFKNIKIDDTMVGLILIPYMHPEVLAKFVKAKIDKEVPLNEQYSRAQDYIKKWIGENLSNIQGADVKLLICHYYPAGAEIRKIPSPEVLPGEFHFTREMLHEDAFDLCIFGHVHLHQALWKNLVVPGSIDRLDFGEREDSKGYIVYDTEKKEWEFRCLECRDLKNIEVDISEEETSSSQELTRTVLAQIPQDIENSWVKLSIMLTTAKRELLNLAEIEKGLERAFHYDIRFINQELQRETILEEFTLNPVTLFRDFVDQSFPDHPYKEDLKKVGLEIINDLLSKMEE